MAHPHKRAKIESIDEHRELVVAHPLGHAIDPDETREFLASMPRSRFASLQLRTQQSQPRIQPRGGFPRFESQLRLTTMLDEAGADFIPLTIDSYTRHNQYDTAAELLIRTEDEEKDYLNGYPLLCHGHLVTRELYTNVSKPISLRHGTPDARLLVEAAIGSGITDIEGGGICYCIPYSESFPLDRALLYWQYVDRVCAWYSTPDRPIHRESFGPLTATMVPPCMVIVVQVIEALLAAEQGIENITVSFGQTGSLVQDLATANVLRSLTVSMLDQHGFGDVHVYLAYHQWMGQFPTERPLAEALISCSALIAQQINADKIIIKTVDEALGIPTSEVNAEATRTVRYVFDAFRIEETLRSDSVDSEADLIRREAESILAKIFELPGTSFWQSVYRAFQLGIIDIPFAPHCDNANRLVTLRDRAGSIRILDAGNVPIEQNELRREAHFLRSRPNRHQRNYEAMLSDIRLMA